MSVIAKQERAVAAQLAASTYPPLCALDRCDAPTLSAVGGRAPCGAAAQVRAVLPSGLDLVFCQHHHLEYVEQLQGLGAELVSQTG